LAVLVGPTATAQIPDRGNGMVLNGPDAPPAPDARPAKAPIGENQEPAQNSAEATTDLLTFFFIVACLAGGVIAIIVAARVYDRFRVDNPIIAAVNDPWVQNKIAQELSAGGEVKLTAADGPEPGRR
jgi:hypothetical protein